MSRYFSSSDIEAVLLEAGIKCERNHSNDTVRFFKGRKLIAGPTIWSSLKMRSALSIISDDAFLRGKEAGREELKNELKEFLK